MLSFESASLIVASLAVLASAAAIEKPDAPRSNIVGKRAAGGVYICTDVNWQVIDQPKRFPRRSRTRRLTETNRVHAATKFSL
jgi:hypothetical protein